VQDLVHKCAQLGGRVWELVPIDEGAKFSQCSMFIVSAHHSSLQQYRVAQKSKPLRTCQKILPKI